MAEAIVFNLAKEILSVLGSNSVQQIRFAWGLKKELRMLEDQISTITNVLQDAQEKEISNLAVKGWLQRLKIVFYDADDLLDEVATEALRKQMETQNSMKREVSDFFSSSNPLKFRYDVGRKIKDIKERLHEIASEMRDFNFVVQAVEKPIEIKRREETSSFVHSPEVIGRDSDKQALIQLLATSSSDEESVHIIPIVGMGGLGKTTLAQLVYNNNSVINDFSKRLWVCVSNDFDIKSILMKLLAAAGDNSCNNLGIEQLQSRVRQILSREKFFLVLDDVWSEDPVEWKKLKDLLITGTGGSRIVVTTRSKKVASIVCTMDPYELEGLSDNDCLEILVEWAFEKGDEGKHQNLINIGRKIVKKCGGIPLAARTLGAYLFSKTNERDWLSVSDNEMWALVQTENDILPVLKLSYEQMPSYLKQCFAYCSLFEKDQIIYPQKLIYGWMAQGFIQSSDKNKELEDIGEDYINELARRSFLQLESKGSTGYKMHDLVHDLAKFVAGEECLIMRGEITNKIPNGVRHVSFDSSSYHEFPEPLTEAKKLRTIVLLRKTNRTFESFVEAVISSFRCLRLLEFNPCHDIIGLPDTIGNLKHLRYLHFHCAKTIPKSICKLIKLQFLDLYRSTLSELPEDFGKLINLRYLRLSSKLTCLPEKEIGGLTSLQTLEIFDNSELTSLGEGIKHLTCLRRLVIFKCPKLHSLSGAIRHLTSLEHLTIFDCETLKFSRDDDLQGLTSLKRLELLELPELVSLPKGLRDAATTLNYLLLNCCGNLTTLSESVLPNLKSLQVLKIQFCPKIVSLPEGMQHLTMLRNLIIEGCVYLRRCAIITGAEWLKIAHVPEISIDRRKIKSGSMIGYSQLINLQRQNWTNVLEVKQEHDLLGFSSADARFWT